MKCTPNYTVSYHGEYHPAGIPFDIEASDAEEMRRHGTVEEAEPKAARKPGRPKKQE